MSVITGTVKKSLGALETTKNRMFGAVCTVSSSMKVYCTFETATVMYSTFESVTINHRPSNKLHFIENSVTCRSANQGYEFSA